MSRRRLRYSTDTSNRCIPSNLQQIFESETRQRVSLLKNSIFNKIIILFREKTIKPKGPEAIPRVFFHEVAERKNHTLHLVCKPNK